MAFSDKTIAAIWVRAGGRCECRREVCTNHLGRCNALLGEGTWHAHHITSQHAGGADTPNNGEALCIPCHQNTRSYGRS